MNAKIWYLYHSGFAVQTAAHFLVFDYWRTSPKGADLEKGVVDPAALREQDVVAFASHSHSDHFNRTILNWREDIPKLRIVLSDDIPAVEGALMIGPGETLVQPDLTVRTLASNDQGVAFIVEVDGLCIYHAGDLNWWHWEGEPDDYNAGMAASYKAQIDLLAGKKIDLAFVPVDPRLEEQYAWGFDYLMRTAEVSRAVPMHFGDQTSAVGRLLQDPVSESWRDRVIGFVRRGESAEI